MCVSWVNQSSQSVGTAQGSLLRTLIPQNATVLPRNTGPDPMLAILGTEPLKLMDMTNVGPIFSMVVL